MSMFPVARVRSVHVYPVKSLAGVQVPHAVVERWGLRGDRRWMVVDHRGEVLTARERPGLLALLAVPDGDGLTVSGPGLPSLRLDPPDGAPQVPVGLSRLDRATTAGDEADSWFSTALGEPVRLVWLDDPRRRPVAANHGGVGDDSLSLADAGPLLLTSTTSLAQLDEWVAQEAARRGDDRPEPLSMTRFRPNVVVGGDLAAFAEDDWAQVRIGDVVYRRGELCDRCVLPLIDPVTLERGKEPLRSLARHRRWDHEVWFGVRLIPMSAGALRVGDEVRVRSAE